MKHSKKNHRENFRYEDYDDEDRPVKRKEPPRRRPIRNWTRAWEEHQDDWDEQDDFYAK